MNEFNQIDAAMNSIGKESMDFSAVWLGLKASSAVCGGTKKLGVLNENK